MGGHTWQKSEQSNTCGVCANFWSGEQGPGTFLSCNFRCQTCLLEVHAACREFASNVHHCEGGRKLELLHLQPPSDAVIDTVKAQKGKFCIRLLSMGVDVKNQRLREELRGAYLYGILNIPGVDGVIKTDASQPMDSNGNCAYTQNMDNEYSKQKLVSIKRVKKFGWKSKFSL